MSRTDFVDDASQQADDSIPVDSPDGGREGPVLDMSNPGDRFKLAEAIRRGWEITPERKAQYFEQLDRVMANLDAITDPMQRAKCVAQCTRVLVAEQGQALRDLHHTERLQHEAGILDLRLRRAEEGKPNDCVAVQLQTPVRELPLPDGLRHYRKRVLESEN